MKHILFLFVGVGVMLSVVAQELPSNPWENHSAVQDKIGNSTTIVVRDGDVVRVRQGTIDSPGELDS